MNTSLHVYKFYKLYKMCEYCHIYGDYKDDELDLSDSKSLVDVHQFIKDKQCHRLDDILKENKFTSLTCINCCRLSYISGTFINLTSLSFSGI